MPTPCQTYFQDKRAARIAFRDGSITEEKHHTKQTAVYKTFCYAEYRAHPTDKKAFRHVLDLHRSNMFDTFYKLREDFYAHRITETQFRRRMVNQALLPISNEFFAEGLVTSLPDVAWWRPRHNAIRISDDLILAYDAITPHTITKEEGDAMCPASTVVGEKALRGLYKDFQ